MLFDGHIHTHYSHDSTADPHAMCDAALAAGLGGIAVTDHCDIQWEIDVATPIAQSFAAAQQLREDYCGRLKVLCGVEFGEALWQPEKAEAIAAAHDFDVIIGSVHAVRYPPFTVPFSWIVFPQFTEQQRHAYLEAYFRDMLALVEQGGFDVLAHPPCVLRYITGKYGYAVDLTRFGDSIDAVLHAALARDIALEINTAVPFAETIWQRYYALGGRRITLGSDAHTPDRVGDGLRDAAAQLRRIGFREVYYYERRRPVALSLEG